MRRKGDLPVKTCAVCGRPMVWRKAWEKVWDEVKYCSDRCRGQRGKGGPSAPLAAKSGSPPRILEPVGKGSEGLGIGLQLVNHGAPTVMEAHLRVGFRRVL
ncbi:MAG: DUF2256 domain-containing protein [Paracoccaceae bacterium]